jgi:beta-lactamase regulating signal transducer with metallopeptidase domain
MESSISLLLFIVVYRLLIANLTCFSWMRYYLLASLVLSLVIPIIKVPVYFGQAFNVSGFLSDTGLIQAVDTGKIASNTGTNATTINESGFGILSALFLIFTLTYFSGLIVKSVILFKNLKGISKLISQNSKQREGNYWIVDSNYSLPAFSFLNYIFLNKRFKNLTPEELLKVKNHELIHAGQHHTFDILLIEAASIFFWFNPVMRYIKRSIQEIHEYIADEEIAGSGQQKEEYAGLLLNLATESIVYNISAGFAMHQIRKRIVMLKRPRSGPLQRIAFFAIIPVTFISLLSFSSPGSSSGKDSNERYAPAAVENQEKLGEIAWTGNKVYSTDRLNEVFGLKKGDAYNPDDINRRLKLEGISELYLDNGFVFFRPDYTEKHHDGFVDLVIEIYEGKIARIGDLSIKADIILPPEFRNRNTINIHPGDLFSKAEIMKLVNMIAGTGKFDRDKINPKPVVNEKKSTDEYAVIDLFIELKGIK